MLTDFKRYFTSVIIFFSLFFAHAPGFAQYNVLGKPGLIKIPKPSVWNEREYLKLQMGYLPIDYSINNFMYRKADELFYTFQFLPLSWLSVNFILTRPINISRIGVGDRHIDFQLFLLKQEKHSINLSVIVSPMLGSSFLDHNSVFLSRKFTWENGFSIEPVLGYGLPKLYKKPFENMGYPSLRTQWIPKSEFGNYYLSGFFSGVQGSFKEKYYLSAEYDTQVFNFSASAMLFNRLGMQISLLDLNKWAGSLSYRWFVDKSKSKQLRTHEK